MSGTGLSEEHVEIQGPALAWRFTLQFQGSFGFAEIHQKTACELLRNRNGEWRSFQCKSLASRSVDILVGRDEKPEQIRCEGATKRLVEIVRCAQHSWATQHGNYLKWMDSARPRPASSCRSDLCLRVEQQGRGRMRGGQTMDCSRIQQS